MYLRKKDSETSSTNSDNAWLRWTPWLGITSVLSMFLCAAACGAIVGISHGDLVEDWKIKPAVLLAILSAASNIGFSTALATGIAVRFWLHATRGALLTQLHYIWDHGRGLGLIQAFRAGSEARKVAIIATLSYIVQFSTGPLLQRATYQVAQEHHKPATLFLDISSQIPDGHFGVVDADGEVVANRRTMSQAQDWYRNASITTSHEPGYACSSGTCTGHVQGAGFTFECTPFPQRDIAMLDPATDGEFVFQVKPLWNSTTSTDIDTSTSQTTTTQPQGQITLTTTYISSLHDTCIATLSGSTCLLRSATTLYPVVVTNSTLSLRYPDLLTSTPPITPGDHPLISPGDHPLISPGDHPLISPGDAFQSPSGTPAGPLRGLHNFLDTWLAEGANKSYNTAVNKTLYTGTGCIADIFFRPDPWDYDPDTNRFIQCGLVWDDPTEWVLRAAYDFMFRVALRTAGQRQPIDDSGGLEELAAEGGGAAAAGLDRQEFAVEKLTNELVFRSDFRYLSAALVATAACLGLMLMLIWGWWQLEQKVTLSPLETARVFGDWVGGGGEGAVGEVEGKPVEAAKRKAAIEDILEAVKGVELKVDEGGRGVLTRVATMEVKIVDGGKGPQPKHEFFLARAKTMPT